MAQDAAAANENTSAMRAAVNAVPAGHEALYDAQGRQLWVGSADVGYWLEQGYSRTPFDPEAMRSDLDHAFEDARHALMALGDKAAEPDAVLSRDEASELAVAHMAVGHLVEMMNHYVHGVEVGTKLEEAEPVEVEENGVTLKVDPGQVEPEKRLGLKDAAASDDEAVVPEAVKAERMKRDLDERHVPNALRPAHLHTDAGKDA